MNEKTINEQYTYIRSLLEEKRLKEALMQLESLLWQCPDWDLRTRLEQLQTSYKYMLEYMRQGANDPERWNVYRKLVADTWEIADRSRLLMLDNASSRYYHEVRRTPRPESLSAYTLKKLLHMLESFNDDLAVSGLLSDEKMDEVLKRHEETLKYMFLQTWTNSAWTPEEEEDAQSMLTSELLPVNDLCLFNFFSLLSLAVEGVTSFTVAPLRISTFAGIIVSLVAFIYMCFIMFKTLIWGEVVQGFPTLMVVILFLGGIQLLSLGVIGEYIGRIFNETKNRPTYIAREYNGVKQ